MKEKTKEKSKDSDKDKEKKAGSHSSLLRFLFQKREEKEFDEAIALLQKLQ